MHGVDHVWQAQGLMLVWADLETTGTDLDVDEIIEAAFVVTDNNLNVIDSIEAVVRPLGWDDGRMLERVDPDVVQMHTDNGLWDEVAVSVSDILHLDWRVSQWVHELSDPDQPLPLLCGTGVHFDRAFMGVHMPNTVACLHYRNLDCQSMREAARLWNPLLFDDVERVVKSRDGAVPHRARSDVDGSIEAMREWRALFAV